MKVYNDGVELHYHYGTNNLSVFRWMKKFYTAFVVAIIPLREINGTFIDPRTKI